MLLSVTIGIFAGVFSVALMNGMIAQRIDAALNDEISHIQITGKDFRINDDPHIIIKNHDRVISVIDSVPGIAGFSERTIITGMANTAGKSVGVQITGIDPVKEKQIFSLWQKIMPGTGTWFAEDSKLNPALIGQDLAKDLNIIRYQVDSSVLDRLRKNKVPEEILDKLSPLAGKRYNNEKKFVREMKSLFTAREAQKYGQVIRQEAWTFREGARFTLTFPDMNNNLVGAVFRISGLYDVKNNIFEKSMVFVRNEDLRKLAGIDSTRASNELIVRLDDVNETDNIAGILAEKLPFLEVITWKKLQPDLAIINDMVKQFYTPYSW